MAKDNQNLKHLVQDSLQLEPVRSKTQKPRHALQGIRDHAARLHAALMSRWSCACDYPHHAHLRLEQRDWSEPPCFRLTFPIVENNSPDSTWTWYRTEIKHHERKGLVTQIDNQSNPAQSSSLRHPEEQHRNLGGQNVATRPAKTTISKSNLSASLQRLRHAEKKKVAWAVVPGIQVASVQLTDIPNPPSLDEPRIIDDLCHSLRSITKCEDESCVGRLEDEQSSYSVYAVSRCAYQDVDATNLYDLLSQNQSPSTAVSNRLTRKIRLQLAVILASTALQLHTTPWLDSSWNGKIINFHQGALNHPYISKVFAKATPTQPIEKPTLGPVRNQTLFALGILLLELSTGKPLDSFKDPQNSGPFEEFVTASQVLQAISEEESSNYYEAAQACVFCNFRGSAKDLNLANDVFRQAFYEDVVVPLEEDLKYYCRA